MTTPHRRGRWLYSFAKRPDARHRVVCFPFSGGGASAFRRWTAELGSADVVIAELPGRGTRVREALRQDLMVMAAEIAEEIAALDEGPTVALFGHSLGSLLAYEVATALRRSGHMLPDLLVAAGGRAPNTVWRPLLPPDLTDDDLIEMVSRMGGMPEGLRDHPDLLHRSIPILRADLEMLDAYEHGSEPPLPIPVVVFGGARDEVVELAALDGWEELSEVGAALEILPGGHFTMLNESLPTLLSSLARHLDAIPADRSRSRRTA